MNTLTRISSRSLLIAGAALILQAAGARAADIANDPQADARTLLSHYNAVRPSAGQVSREHSGITVSEDPQNQARALLGRGASRAAPHVRATPAVLAALGGTRQADPVADPADVSQMARRMILGRQAF